MAAKNVKETTVYKKAFALAMEIFAISKRFPSEEKFPLTIKSGGLLEAFAFACRRHIERKDMLPILYIK